MIFKGCRFKHNGDLVCRVLYYRREFEKQNFNNSQSNITGSEVKVKLSKGSVNVC